MSVHDLSAVGADVKDLPVRAADPGHDPLLVLALQNQVSVETIERLVALRERADERSAREAYFAALRSFSAACPPVQKTSKAKITTRTGGGYEYAYAELDEIAETVRPHLEANGFAYTWDCELSTDSAILITICTLRHVAGHMTSSRFPVPTASSSAMSDQQRYAAAFTFGRRQSLFGVLGLSTTEATPDEPGQMATITAEQAANLESLLDETKRDRVKFLRYAGAASLAEIAAGRYAELVALLEQARKAGAR